MNNPKRLFNVSVKLKTKPYAILWEKLAYGSEVKSYSEVNIVMVGILYPIYDIAFSRPIDEEINNDE